MSRSRDVAIIGMAGRYPQSESPAALWRHIVANTDLSSDLRADDKSAESGRVTRHFELRDIDMFDHDFFAYTPFEAMVMDPQQRLLLTCAYRAMEDAGYERLPDRERVGVYASASVSTYLLHQLIRSQLYDPRDLNYQMLLGNDKDALATRIAYKLNLNGPALSVQTACSSSLVAAHIACQSLLLGDCDIAVVAAASITVPQDGGYYRKEGGVLSKDGYCRPFDAEASGTVKGNGCTVMVLRRRDDAERAGDRIRALIRSTAVNNDGMNKLGFTAPSAAGQRQVIEEALAYAELKPEQIDYIETHGTGTELGDPIELSALAQVYGQSQKRIPVGSLKANIGHLDAAAGLSGLAKACFVLAEGVVPPIQHLRRVSEAAASTRFEFPQEQSQRPLQFAAVSSFGIGGTNAHAVLERHAPSVAAPARPPTQFLVSISVDRAADLQAYCISVAAALEGGASLLDVAATLLMRRKRRQLLRSVVIDSRAALLNWLAASAPLPQPDAGLRQLPRFTALELQELAAGWPAFAKRLPADASAHTAALALAELLIGFGVLSHPQGRRCAVASGLDESGLARALAGHAATLASALLDEEQRRAGAGATALARLFEFLAVLDASAALQLDGLYAGTAWRSIPLPAYPLHERRHWVEADEWHAQAPSSAVDPSALAVHRHDEQLVEDIVSIWRELTGVTDLDGETPLVDTGADSMTAIEIVDKVNRSFQCQIGLDMSVAQLTPTQMAELVLGRELRSSMPWVSYVRFKPKAVRTIFLIHPAGGSTYCYSSLARHLQGNYNIRAIDLPEGYQGYGSMRQLAERYAELIDAEETEGALLLGGYSFGGNLAHEVGAVLEQRGRTVQALVLFDAHVPQAYNRYQGGALDYVGAFPTLVTAYFKPELLDQVLSESAQLTELDQAIALVRRHEVLNSKLANDDVARFYQRWTFSHELLKRHRPGHVCKAQAHVLVAVDDEPSILLEKLKIERLDKSLWREFFGAEPRLRPVSGDHFTMFGDADKVRLLAREFDVVMAELLSAPAADRR
ncbi:beta-ketoacyl synthase N-terminal-like domain-containing protein [Paucibacter sp. APW11]|uniref:Beta-ketoacyl synthase N-terminal-like domain-containing protein n=1 Tax=Roseateles aquae TaxID=3077235 RepID=A0ABU3PA80_9BURK|nr:beta-ketoacyl synthase N-terminal-like domain-containing protein [Paucibacter sp. APW11]MDT8999135.1 beta-ketoacyl synthase N-terminal-like domain-containing protein [Paucibacter sp. APW11]